MYEAPDEVTPAAEADYIRFLLKHPKGLQKAIYRPADEVDALRERAGPE